MALFRVLPAFFAIFIPSIFLSAQNIAVEWTESVKSEKTDRTLAILDAGPEGFHLLRLKNQAQHPQPYISRLSASGSLISSEELLSRGKARFLFAVPGQDNVLIVFTEDGKVNMQRYDLGQNRFSEAAVPLFPAEKDGLNVRFARSAGDSLTSVFQFDADGTLHAVILDHAFNLLWGKTLPVPSQNGPVWAGEVLLTRQGELWCSARVFDPSMQGKTGITPAPAVTDVHGNPVYRLDPATEKMQPHALQLLRVSKNMPDFGVYYPQTGYKYTCSATLAEDSLGHIWMLALCSNESPEYSQGYIFYQVNPEDGAAAIVKKSPYGSSIRKAFLSEKAAEKKEPVKGLQLRSFSWAADGEAWIFLEQENPATTSLGNAAIIRIDSNYRMASVKPIQKQQIVQAASNRQFVGLTATPGKAKGWELYWNQGEWPATAMMAGLCKNGGQISPVSVFEARKTKVSFLPGTLRNFDGTWYLVGESEYGEQYRIGRLSPEK